ncbi:hypothetical protein LOSG293_210350 [Secundilactobacillus oryzae JCM 18671]|uniref:Uncharacterized protein n=1 Tax=Secundilactobacillus oryzae JCM 18671 TaxID=1291743 RepID=A0A081BJJ3_9LACO|nr:hypothetical protein [Secundilactobacillus oryzae]GAK48211.1 hypothetical protein LOSG293_210350 [Secundilactobacillus oryzae JCM 18671]
MKKFAEGQLVKYESVDEWQGPIVGKVIHVLNRLVVIEVLNYHFKDRRTVAAQNFIISACPTKLKLMKVVNYGF